MNISYLSTNDCHIILSKNHVVVKTVPMRRFMSHKTNTNDCHIILSKNNVIVQTVVMSQTS